ncbi:MAG: ThuA domain-containing protein [Planctomycetia bacterium]|nr:ThuA domain-containing protein [Planctomycetia bacterium]
MKRREMLLSTAAAIGLSQFPLGWAGAANQQKRKVLFFTKSAGFEHSSIRRNGDNLSHAEQTLTDMGKDHNFEVNCTKDGRVFDSDLAGYDAIFFYTTGDLTTEGSDKNPPMSADGKKRLFDTIAAGKGFLASHCGADTFHSAGPARERQTDVDPYIAMLGGEFISHGPQQKSRQVIASPKFPGLAGAADGSGTAFKLNDEWYSLKNFAPDLHVILVQDTQGMNGKDYERPPYPATWARRHGKGRVFYTSMGHREDVWTNPKFQQILLGGLAWACGNVDFDVPSNIKEAAPGADVMPPK